MLIAREFCLNDETELLNMVQEIQQTDGNFEGLDNLSKFDNIDSFLTKLKQNKHQAFLRPGLVPQTTFGVFDGSRLVGGFNLRHRLCETLLQHGGNIGYLIRPSQRQKGYGTALLSLALKEAKAIGLEKVLVSCREENIFSSKVIEHNQGRRDKDYFDESSNTTYRRYWINLTGTETRKKVLS